MLDLTTEFGRRVAERLRNERIIWLTTVAATLRPQPRPVWFLWDGATFLIYSQPNTYKLLHIVRNPQVAVHFDSDGHGGNIVVFNGEASIAADMPPANEVGAYIEKYQADLTRLQTTPRDFAEDYSVAIRVAPTKLRGF